MDVRCTPKPIISFAGATGSEEAYENVWPEAPMTDYQPAETGDTLVAPPARQWHEPAWEEVAPGIFCQLMATDTERHRVSMLVRLLPGVNYPPHTHAGLEELFLLDGELWINDRKLYPGDYNRAESGSGDKRGWSETGCTCVLITSTDDILGS
jgi:anti-sigma factor ChrR (cupin superfamily)